MKKLILLLLLPSLVWSQVPVAIENLPAVPSLVSTDQSIIERVGSSYNPGLATLAQISAFILGPSSTWTGATITVPFGGTGVQSITGPIKGNGVSAFTAAAASDIYALWSGACSSATFLRGDGSCQTPAGSGNVSNSGTPTSGQFAEWSSATVLTGQTMGGDCTLATATMTCLKTNGTSFGSLATLSIATVGTGGLNTTTAPSSTQIPIAQSSSAYAPKTVSGDCTLAATGAITCTKVNGQTLTLNQTSSFTGVSGNIAPLEIQKNTQTGNYTGVLADNGKEILMNCASACTFTIPSNASVAYPTTTAVPCMLIYNPPGGSVVTIAINTDTLTLLTTGVTGSRTLTAPGKATICEDTATQWTITGANVT